MTEQGELKEKAAEAKTVLEEILRLMGFEGKIEAFEQVDEVLLHIESPDAGRLIGRDAQVLDALQTLLYRMLAKKYRQAVRCIVDVERYRERRKDRLLKMAFDAADEALRTGRPVRLPPMDSAERRIVHQALKDRTDVATHSEEVGEHGEKQVVVAPRTGAPPSEVISESEPPAEPTDSE